MKRVRTGAVWVIMVAGMVIGWLLLARQSTAQEQTGNWGPSVKGLACSIRTGKSTYAIGENISLEFFLRGEHEAGVQVMNPRIDFMFYGDALPLAITGPDGKHVYRGPVLDPPPPPSLGSFIAISQGEIRGVWSSHRKPLRIVAKSWGITRPGAYTIRFTYRPHTDYMDNNGQIVKNTTAWAGELTSNTVTITVK